MWFDVDENAASITTLKAAIVALKNKDQTTGLAKIFEPVFPGRYSVKVTSIFSLIPPQEALSKCKCYYCYFILFFLG